MAFFADRCDIQEELVRFNSHLAQMSDVLQKGTDVGRTLDFLVQEMLREANTLGSKSADVEITRGVLSLKMEIERLREQVANIE